MKRSRSYRADMATDTLRVGITCYPSVGGSGILATALGDDLAARGHDVHFISYERPFRLPSGRTARAFPPGRHQRLRAVQVPRLHAAALREDGRGEPRASARRAARPLRRAARHGRDPRAVDAAARPAAPGRHHAARHRHHAARPRPRLRPGHPPRARPGPTRSRSCRSTSATRPGACSTSTGPIDVVHNFFEPRPPGRARDEVPPELGVADEVVVLHSSNLPPGQAGRPAAGGGRAGAPARVVPAGDPGRRGVRAVRRRRPAARPRRPGDRAREASSTSRTICRPPTSACSRPTPRASA